MPRLLRLIAAQDAEVVAEWRPLHLDHVGAKVGEEGGAVGSRDDAGEIEDADAFEEAHDGVTLFVLVAIRMQVMPDLRGRPISAPESGTITPASARAPCRSGGARWTAAPP